MMINNGQPEKLANHYPSLMHSKVEVKYKVKLIFTYISAWDVIVQLLTPPVLIGDIGRGNCGNSRRR